MQVNYGYIENGKIIAPVAMRSRFNNVGAWHTLTDEQRAKYRWYPCDVINEGYNPRLQLRSSPKLTFTGTRIVCEYTVTDKTLDEIRQDLKSELAAYRYEVETGGIEINGTRIHTDRESHATVNAAYTALKDGLLLQTHWKDASGQFQPVTLAEITPIATAVSQHVGKCFTAEGMVSSQIDNLTMQEVETFDTREAFDQEYASLQ